MTLALSGISELETEFTLPLYDAQGSLNGAQVKHFSPSVMET